MRIVHDNAFDRAAVTVTASQGGYVAANLKLDIKSLTWRSGSVGGSIIATWAVAENISAIILPFCNLSKTAVLTIRLYSGADEASKVYDSGSIIANAATRIIPKNMTAAQAATAYELGAGACVAVYLPSQFASKKLIIDIYDPQNVQGNIDVSRVIAGAFFEPKFGANYGLSATSVDSSKNTRSRAGDLLSDVGTTSRKLSFTLGDLKPQDRTEVAKILIENGIRNPLWISLFPQSADLNLERDHQCYGKLTQSSAITLPHCNSFVAPQVEIESV
jgi:hypothetical protein